MLHCRPADCNAYSVNVLCKYLRRIGEYAAGHDMLMFCILTPHTCYVHAYVHTYVRADIHTDGQAETGRHADIHVDILTYRQQTIGHTDR